MKIAYKVLPVFLVCICIIGVCADASASTQSELWQKAVSITSKENWLPGQIREHERVFNEKGKIEEESESLIQLQNGKNGDIVMTLVEYLKDGKEANPKDRQEAENERAGTMTFDALKELEENPFLPELQPIVNVTPLEQEKTIDGVRCMAFRYAYEANFALISKAQNFRIEGIAWLAENSGVPYEVEYELAEGLPAEEKDFKVTGFKEKTRYAYSEQGEWYPLENVADSTFELKILLLTFKGRSLTTSNYSQHWKYDAAR